MVDPLAIVLALLAAATFALSAILQQRAAREAPKDESLRPSLLITLAGRGRFLLGIAALIIAYLLQAIAFALTSVAFVEPLIVTELVFAVPIAIRLERRSPGRREWAGVIAVVAGVSLFLVFSKPHGGSFLPGLARWGPVALTCGGIVLACVLVAGRKHGPRRAALSAWAAGVLFGLLALVTKSATTLLATGFVALVTSWQPYVLVALGIFGMLLAQSAYQAAPLAESLPIIDSIEPLTGVVCSALCFGQRIDLSLGPLFAEMLGAVVALVGIFLLGRSPLVLSIYQQNQKKRERAQRRSSTSAHRERATSKVS